MSEQKSNGFVNLIKKSVGLPTGNSNCCSAPAAGAVAQESSCCNSAETKTETKTEAKAGSCCSTGSAPTNGGSCCG